MREFPSHAEILKIFEKSPRRQFRLHELVAELGLRSSQARQLRHSLKELCQSRRLIYLRKNHFALAHKDRFAAKTAGGRAEPRHAGAGHAGHAAREQAVRTPAPSGTGRRNVIAGRFIGHRDGFAFVVPEKALAESSQDIFIPPGATGSAMHGDRVEVVVTRSRPPRPGGPAGAGLRLEGRVVSVAERAQKTVVGEFRCGEHANVVLPFDFRIPHEIVIPRGAEWPQSQGSRDRQFGGESEGGGEKPRSSSPRGARDARELHGAVVDVEITNFPGPGSAPRGRVTEVLGRRDDFGVDVEIIIRKFHLPHRFPSEALDAATAAPQSVSESDRRGRRDFRSHPIVTIDGETAKDFDDAVYVERLSGGRYLLHVHIADVANYVRPESALDREARLRGTSVYFPDRAVPMLPLELSNGICSLNPRLDRLVMSALMEIDAQGRVVAYELAPGVIHSAERMTYTAVRDILAGDAAATARYKPLVENFRLMEELAKILMAKRDRRGSIDFDLPEPEIEFDEHGRMVGVTRSERNIAHRIIEEFMLAANETVAGFIEDRGAPVLFRIHEKPDPKKVLEFEEIAATFGVSLGVMLPAAQRIRVARRDTSRREERYPRFHQAIIPGDLKITPFHYQHLTERIAGRPEERILSYLMLRSLKQARYSGENVGHFALAAPTYTHFTSPIRRYPDLVVHRVLKALLARPDGGGERDGIGVRVTVPAHQLERKYTGERSSLRPGRGFPDTRHQAPQSTHGGAPHHAVHGGEFYELDTLRSLGLETSESERRAQDAERELMEWKKVRFMSDRVGDEFDALIISLTRNGFFVELTDLFVEGYVPLESLEGDRYVYRERQRAVIGEKTKRAFRLGQQVRVRLDRIEREGNKLQFSVVEPAAAGPAR